MGRGRATAFQVTLGLAVLLAGCGGGGSTSTGTQPEASGTTTSKPGARTDASEAAPPAAAPSRRRGPSPATRRGRPQGPSPAECVDAWNRVGLAPSLAHVLLPTARVAGPFRGRVAVVFSHRRALGGECAVVVYARGVEGAGDVAYIAVRSPGAAGFVQSLQFRGPRQVLGPDTPAVAATLKRDGSLSASR